MSYRENIAAFGLPEFTSASLAATGATSLVAAPGEGVHIAIDAVRYLITTDTASDLDLFLTLGTGGSNAFRVIGKQTDTAMVLNEKLDYPLIVGSNTAVLFNCTVTAASTPGALCEIRFRRLRQ